MFGVQGLTLTEISEATIAWRKLQGPTRAWRYAISQVFQSDRRADTTQESAARDIIDFTVRAERHFRRPASDRLTTYWGVGPLVGFRYSDYAYTDHEGTESGDIRRALGSAAPHWWGPNTRSWPIYMPSPSIAWTWIGAEQPGMMP